MAFTRSVCENFTLKWCSHQTVIQPRLLSICHVFSISQPDGTVIDSACQRQMLEFSVTDCTLLVGGQLINRKHISIISETDYGYSVHAFIHISMTESFGIL